MAGYTGLDSIQRPSTGGTAIATWGDAVNDDTAFLYGDAGWTAVPSFTNTWTSASGPVGYILVGRVVYLRGDLGAGTANTAAFTLPVGYRPSINMENMVLTSTGVNWAAFVGNAVTVNSTGTVVPLLSAATRLDFISFPVV